MQVEFCKNIINLDALKLFMMKTSYSILKIRNSSSKTFWSPYGCVFCNGFTRECYESASVYHKFCTNVQYMEICAVPVSSTVLSSTTSTSASATKTELVLSKHFHPCNTFSSLLYLRVNQFRPSYRSIHPSRRSTCTYSDLSCGWYGYLSPWN